MSNLLPQPNPGHQITVTTGVFGRSYFDCSCGASRTFASKRPAVQVAMAHWRRHHAPLLPSDFRPVVDVAGAAGPAT